MRIHKILLLVWYLVISANNSAFAQDVSKPTTDFMTPESALKSYWAVKDWLHTTRVQLSRKYDDELYKLESESFISVTTDDTKLYFETFKKNPDDVFERNIVEITMENSTQAVIRSLIKNITPIPEKAVPTPRKVEIRKKGREFIYTLTKELGEWKVSEIRMAPNEFWPIGKQQYERISPLYPYDVYFD